MLISSDSYIHPCSIGYTAYQPRDWIASVDCDATVQTHGGITTAVTTSAMSRTFAKRRAALFRLAATV